MSKIRKVELNNKKGLKTSEAIVLENLPGNMCKVILKNSSKPILGYLSGNMVRNHIRLIKDDIVIVEYSTSDNNRCRVVFRK